MGTLCVYQEFLHAGAWFQNGSKRRTDLEVFDTFEHNSGYAYMPVVRA